MSEFIFVCECIPGGGRHHCNIYPVNIPEDIAKQPVKHLFEAKEVGK